MKRLVFIISETAADITSVSSLESARHANCVMLTRTKGTMWCKACWRRNDRMLHRCGSLLR